MRKAAVKAGIRKSKAAVAQPEGSSYAGKAAKKKPEISQQAVAEKIDLASQTKPGRIVHAPNSKNFNPFRADKELSRKVI